MISYVFIYTKHTENTLVCVYLFHQISPPGLNLLVYCVYIIHILIQLVNRVVFGLQVQSFVDQFFYSLIDQAF